MSLNTGYPESGESQARRATQKGARHRFVMVSSCLESWGGSEELWSGAAMVLAQQGHRIAAFKTGVDRTHPRIRRLTSLACKVRDLQDRRLRFAQRILEVLSLGRYDEQGLSLLSLALHLKIRRPDLVVISQGDNVSGLHFAHLCRKYGVPYIIICQKAADHVWPTDEKRGAMRAAYESAARCFFVSQHNQALTEQQIGWALKNATVVRNPFLVSPEQVLPWPEQEENGVRLACVARLQVVDKGQDILLRVLAKEKWKARKLSVAFFGEGLNREGLMEMAGRLGVTNVSFAGYTDNVPCIWEEHHALVLASRAEGLPLVLVEAMMCGRPAIVTNVGGNAEIVEDKMTGFLAAAATEEAMDAALEAAWQQRHQWRAIGDRAARKIREIVPAQPAENFAHSLLEVVADLKRETRNESERQLKKVKTTPGEDGVQ